MMCLDSGMKEIAINVRLQPDLHRALVALAMREDRSLASLVRIALAQWLANHKTDKKD